MPGRHSGDQVHKAKKKTATLFFLINCISRYWGNNANVSSVFFSHHDVRDNPRNATKLLAGLAANDTRIVVMITQPDVQVVAFYLSVPS